jgi:hypothetical protein
MIKKYKTHLEVQDDGPDKAESELGITCGEISMRTLTRHWDITSAGASREKWRIFQVQNWVLIAPAGFLASFHLGIDTCCQQYPPLECLQVWFFWTARNRAPSGRFVACGIAFFPFLEAKKTNIWCQLHKINGKIFDQLTKCSPESTSNSDSKLCPSRKSSNRSSTRRDACAIYTKNHKVIKVNYHL